MSYNVIGISYITLPARLYNVCKFFKVSPTAGDFGSLMFVLNVFTKF